MVLYINFPDWLHPEVFPGFHLFGIKILYLIRWYSLSYIFGFLASFYLFRYQLKKQTSIIADATVLADFYFWLIIAVLICGRIFASIFYVGFENISFNPIEWFNPFIKVGDRWVFHGLSGMSYHGAIIGVALAIVIYCKIKKIEIRSWADMALASAPLPYTLGRLANFANGELWGRPTAVPWGVRFPNATPVSLEINTFREIAEKVNLDLDGISTIVNLPRHPSQLYEAFFEGIVLGLIVWFLKDKKPFKGFLIGTYLIGYGIFRFIIEYFREPDEVFVTGNKVHGFIFLNFSMGQILCLIMIIAGIIAYIWCYIIQIKENKMITKVGIEMESQ